MSVIYLRHPRHGTKVACSEMEAVYDETNGWQRFTLAAPVAPAPEDEPESAPEDEQPPEVDDKPDKPEKPAKPEKPPKRKYTRRAK